MADQEAENITGFADVRRIQAGPGVLATAANYDNVTTLRARLVAINAAYFTTAKLNNMTKNDMVYAVRLNDDAAGVK